MFLRRTVPLALASLAILACEPSVDQRPLPGPVDAAVFDPTTGRIPLPNDLALASIPAAAVTAGCPATSLPSAQAQLLCQFAKAGGFPNDQEAAITVDFTRTTFDPATKSTTTAPSSIDLASVKVFGTDAPPNVAIIRIDGTPGPVAVDTGSLADLDAATRGRMTLHNQPDAAGSRRWPAGARYVVAVRGGASGVKTTGNGPVAAASTMFVLLQSAIADKDLTQLENQGALPGTAAQKAAAAAQLEPIRRGVIKPALGALLATGAWPLEETISIQTFGIAPASTDSPTVVEVDQSKGSVPLPSNLLRDATTGRISGEAACSLVQGTFNPADRSCSNPASAGFQALDGFSTTALVLAPVSFPVDAATVNAANVFLYKVTTTGTTRTAARLTDLASALGAGQPATAKYVTQPTPLTAPCTVVNGTSGTCSSAIGLAPAVPTPVAGLVIPPLDEASTYAVVVTNRVKDAAGRSLGRSTLAKLVLDVTLPLTANGQSVVGGVDTPLALALEDMKANLAPVLAGLPAGTTRADVVMAYTFRTQTNSAVSLTLAAAPYGIEKGANTAFFAVTAAAPTDSPFASPNVANFFAIEFNSIDGIDKTSGAFRPTLAADLADSAVLPTLITPLKALVAVPLAANVPFCPDSTTVRCAKVAVVGHGITGSKTTLFRVADRLAQSGYVAVATDFPLHGDRAWCKADAECSGGGVCTPFPGAAGQGDATPPGTCTTAPIDAISGQFYLSGNFFRLRDANRQNVLDQSALVLAMARPPTSPQPGTDVRAGMLPAGVVIDPSAVRYVGLSLGSIGGTSVLATNPRFDRAVLSVGGGTFVDIGNTSPDFQPTLDQVVAGLIPGYSRDAVTPGNAAFDATIAAAFLRVLNVAKLVLDPGEAVNYAQYVRTSPLPNLLADPPGATPQAPKEILAQVATGDTTVPNPTNLLLDTLLGGTTVTYVSDSAPGGAVPHGFLATTPSAQADMAAFLDSLIVPTSTVHLP